MISVQKAIFPGLALGCVFLVFVTSLIANPQIALASNPVASVAVAGVVQAENLNAARGASQEEAAAEQAAGSDAEVEQLADMAQPAAMEQPAAEEQLAAEQPAESQPEAAVSSCSISSKYPEKVLQWCGLIERYSHENNLDPNLIAALILQESGGNSQAYSKSGAVGLMQVMPRDGLAAKFNCINGPCFASRPSMAELYDPEFNVSYGTRMLAGLIRRHGDIREALRSYGPMDMGYRYADIVLGHANRYR
jgi:soluble lytic murein transglycosylase-like protein